jgi:hypothetical protein
MMEEKKIARRWESAEIGEFSGRDEMMEKGRE